MSEKIQKLKVRTLKKIANSQISESEAEKIKNLIPTTKDSQSVFEAKKNSLLKKMSNMNVGGEMLKGGQKKLDKNKDGKISGEDFKMMKASKGKDVDIDLIEKIASQSLFGKRRFETKVKKKSMGGESKGYGAARTQGEGLQDENLIPGKSLDYYKDIM